MLLPLFASTVSSPVRNQPASQTRPIEALVSLVLDARACVVPSSVWIFRMCVVSTTNLYSIGVAVDLAPFAL